VGAECEEHRPNTENSKENRRILHSVRRFDADVRRKRRHKVSNQGSLQKQKTPQSLGPFQLVRDKRQRPIARHRSADVANSAAQFALVDTSEREFCQCGASNGGRRVGGPYKSQGFAAKIIGLRRELSVRLPATHRPAQRSRTVPYVQLVTRM
jgi:hypothetical protein